MGRIGSINRAAARAAIRKSKGNLVATAKELGVPRTTLTMALRTYLVDLRPLADALREEQSKADAARRHFTARELKLIRERGYRQAVEDLGLDCSHQQLARWVVEQEAAQRAKDSTKPKRPTKG